MSIKVNLPEKGFKQRQTEVSISDGPAPPLVVEAPLGVPEFTVEPESQMSGSQRLTAQAAFTGRIRESHPCGESCQEETGNLRELQLQLIKRAPGVSSDKGAQHAAAGSVVPTVPLSEKTEHFANVSLFFLSRHRVCVSVFCVSSPKILQMFS